MTTKEYYEQHKETIKAQIKQWRASQGEKFLSYNREHQRSLYQNNEEYREYKKKKMRDRYHGKVAFTKQWDEFVHMADNLCH